MEITNIDELFNSVSKEELQEKFCEVAMKEIKFLDDTFYNEYFIDIIPSWELAFMRDELPSEIFNNSERKEQVINSFLSNEINIIFYNVYDELNLTINDDIEFDLNKEVLTIFDFTKIIDELTVSIGKFLDSKVDKIIDELRENGIITPNRYDIEDIQNINDKIGETSILIDELDYDNRDTAFIDIDGKILIGENGQTHAQTIQNYLNKISDIELEEEFYRPTDDEIDEMLNPKYTAFGHIVDNNIFIEKNTLNKSTIKGVIQDIRKADIPYDKIYEYKGNEITRVAKKHVRKRTNIK